MSDPHAQTDGGGTAHPEARGPRMPGYLYPFLGLVFGAALVWSFSRILLAVSKTDAAVIALMVALNILIGGALIAYGRRVRRRPTAFPLLVLAVLALIAAGATTSVVYGDRAPEEAAGGEQGGPKVEKVTLVAQGTKFAQTDLTFTAGNDVQMTFDNKDAGIPHNFALFNGPDATAPPIFRGDPVTGPISTTYSFKAPRPGSYFFHCDIHPTVMTGTATVEPAAPGGPPGGGPPPGPLTITAKNTAFSPTSAQASATGQVSIHFQNDDPSVPHNIAIFKGTDATGEVVFRGDLVTGPAGVDYTFPAPPPGTYFFHCDVHPAQMTGTITFG